MRIAAEPIELRFGGAVLQLRPTLRAAIRLERRFGIPELVSSVLDGNVTVMGEIIREAGVVSSPALDVLDRIGDHGLGARVNAVTFPCLAFVEAITDLDDEPTEAEPERSPAHGGKAGPAPELVTWGEQYRRLFGIATGALGWTPDVALNATPAEIVAAYAGRRELISDMLKAVFGEKPKDNRSIGDKLRERFEGRTTRVTLDEPA